MRVLNLCLIVTLFVVFASPAFTVTDNLKPTRENFFGEVLYAKATSVTPLFHDREFSYHVDKLDVFRGLPELARRKSLKLRGLIVIGPVGLMWTYSVIAFLEEGNVIRVNLVVMPHARITCKATGTITLDRYRKFYGDLLQFNILSSELPPKGKCDTCPSPEWDYEILVADLAGKEPEVNYGGRVMEQNSIDPNHEKFQDEVNELLSSLRETYPLKPNSER